MKELFSIKAIDLDLCARSPPIRVIAVTTVARDLNAYTHYFVKCLCAKINIRSTFGKSVGKKVYCLERTVRRGTVPLKDELARDLTYGEQER